MEKNKITQSVKKSFPWIARVLALIAILAFFLPFCTVSCSGQKLDTMSASEMAFGKEFSVMGETEKIDGDAKVLVLLLLPLVVIGCSFIKKHIVSFITYVAEAISLLLYNNYILKSVKEACEQYNCALHTEIGYVLFQAHGWLMLAIGVIGIISVIVLSDKKDETEIVLSDRPFPKAEDTDGASKSVKKPKKEEVSPETIVLRTEAGRTASTANTSSEAPSIDKEWKKPEEPSKQENLDEKALWNRPTGF
ncbi:MAG: hypothetical protein IJI45_11145 [Anaerolineaceae bacterium]|nr:hypothetical protein [Anaerolineaceae bacterium]